MRDIWDYIITIYNLAINLQSTFYLNWTHCVFLYFKDSRLALNHLFIILKVLCIFLFRLSVLWWVRNMLVSSSNKTGTEMLFVILGRSFIYNKNNRGSRSEPCGTLRWISDHFEILKLWDLVLHKSIHWYLSVRQCVYSVFFLPIIP